MKSKSEMICLYFWVKISIFIKNNPNFCNRTGKVFKFIVFIYLVLNLMLRYSTYIYPVILTYKTCQNIFFILPRKLTFLYSGVFWEIHVLLFLRYQGIVIL